MWHRVLVKTAVVTMEIKKDPQFTVISSKVIQKEQKWTYHLLKWREYRKVKAKSNISNDTSLFQY